MNTESIELVEGGAVIGANNHRGGVWTAFRNGKALRDRHNHIKSFASREAALDAARKSKFVVGRLTRRHFQN
jgi:hypothetical protein